MGVHYNPAGLTQIEKVSFQFLPVRGWFTQDILDEALGMTEFMSEVVTPLTGSSNPLVDPSLAGARTKLVDQVTSLSSKHLENQKPKRKKNEQPKRKKNIEKKT